MAAGSLLWLSILSLGCWPGISRAVDSQAAVLLDIKGAIGPAVSDYVIRGLKKAEQDKAGVVILQIDTPGGLDAAMRDIIKNILASSVPVVSYVAPDGARAASAGTYILYASHVAAMAPVTNLGAATPVRVGGLPGMPDAPANPKEKDHPEKKSPLSDTMERKMVNDAVAYIKSLANRHGRNAQWAEQAVREAVSLTAKEALEIGVIDVVVGGLVDLLQQLDGREVLMESGKMTLSTGNLVIERLEPDWRSQLLTIITDPNIAYILMLLGFYGLIFELSNPGYILPGVVGGICLLLALYSFQVLPINYAGLGLMILGIIFMVAEAFVPSFGALGIGGVIAFVFGSVILMNDEGLRISLPLIGGTALVSTGFFLWVMGGLYAISRKKVVTGAEEMIGSVGEAMADFEGEGRVWIHGESWRAVSPAAVIKGQKVQVIEKDGLLLKVKLEEDVK
ncbi:MAG: nodulation protein NfeD [Desulfobulbaceae bacterium]|nr:nodulation protein NfeD [Desulfobulbaceae bacterium]